jgi:uracil-DNA glycosylase
MVKEKLKTLLNTTDRNGKQLLYKPDDGGRIYLDVDGTLKCLGAILLGQNNILYHKYEEESQIFRKTNAWSVNHTVLSVVDLVVYESTSFDYSITRERALEFGEYFHFQDTTELKVYVPLKYWEKRHKGCKDIYPEHFLWRNRVGDSWFEALQKTLLSDLMKDISKAVKQDRQAIGETVYPAPDRVFRAFKLCTFEHTKVVIVGQDPYHDGSANGLAFGYLQLEEGNKKQMEKSLDIIHKEVERDVYDGLHLGYDTSLETWAKQGVLLLNACLTVLKGRPRSHSNIGWERFTRLVLYKLLQDETPKVFILWGNDAKETFKYSMDVWTQRNFIPFPHLVLEGRHPAYDLRNKDQFGEVPLNYPESFSGGKYFSRANEFLKKFGRKEIKW